MHTGEIQRLTAVKLWLDDCCSANIYIKKKKKTYIRKRLPTKLHFSLWYFLTVQQAQRFRLKLAADNMCAAGTPFKWQEYLMTRWHSNASGSLVIVLRFKWTCQKIFLVSVLFFEIISTLVQWWATSQHLLNVNSPCSKKKQTLNALTLADLPNWPF